RSAPGSPPEIHGRRSRRRYPARSLGGLPAGSDALVEQMLGRLGAALPADGEIEISLYRARAPYALGRFDPIEEDAFVFRPHQRHVCALARWFELEMLSQDSFALRIRVQI